MKSVSWTWVIALAVVAAAIYAGTMLAQGGGNQQVTICHLPPGNPSNPQTITVSQSAVAAHQQHGDTLGPCPQSPSQPGRGRGRGQG